AVARDGGLPRVLDHVSKKTSAPDRSILALVGLSFSVLLVFYVFGADLETALLIPSGAAILTYVIGAAAGVRLLKHRVFPYVTLAISLAILPFLGALLLFSLATMAAATLYGRFFRGRRGARVCASAVLNHFCHSSLTAGERGVLPSPLNPSFFVVRRSHSTRTSSL